MLAALFVRTLSKRNSSSASRATLSMLAGTAARRAGRQRRFAQAVLTR